MCSLEEQLYRDRINRSAPGSLQRESIEKIAREALYQASIFRKIQKERDKSK